MPISARGTFFTASSGPGTFVAQAAAITAFSDTGPMWAWNNAAGPSGPSIWPAWLRLALGGAAPTATVSLEFAARVDTISKLPTAANQFTNPAAINQDTTDITRSAGVLYAYAAAAAMVTPASSGNVKNVALARVPTSLGIVGDEYVIQFVDPTGVMPDAPIPGLTAARATAVARITAQAAAFKIAPGAWATFHLWWLTAVGAASFQWELAWFEL